MKSDQYPDFLLSVKARFAAVTKTSIPLFLTDVENVSDLFINNLPEEYRAQYNCRSCFKFLDNFGGLVTVTEAGHMISALWDEATTPDFFKPAVLAIKQAVLNSRISDVFISDKAVLGNPVTGEWEHIAAALPQAMVNKNSRLNAEQLIAKKREDRKDLINSMQDFDQNVINQAVALIGTDTFRRGSLVQGIATWFQALVTRYDNQTNSRSKENLVWYATATAPERFCQVRSSMIGTLLEDIKDGLSTRDITSRFNSKSASDTYQVTQAPPTEGGLREAERLVAETGIEPSLKRRFATLDDVTNLTWKAKQAFQKAVNQSTGGVFGHIKPREQVQATPQATLDLPTTTMTWSKFVRTVLPVADSLEALVDSPNRLMAMVTASNPTAPNILQWGNPLSWYYHGGIDGEIKRRVEAKGGRYENNDIRCSLIWDGYTDLDLGCYTPTGYHITYPRDSRRSPCGGELDIDANGLDTKTVTPVENIRWAKGRARNGTYRFYVKNYTQDSGSYSTRFRANLEINGQIFNVEGNLRNKQEVTVFAFEYRNGQVSFHATTDGVSTSSATSSGNNDWGVAANSFVKVNAITDSPNMWGDTPVAQRGHHVFFLLDGVKDTSEGKGKGVIIEMLKSDYRDIRRVLEAHYSAVPVEGVEEASACGVGYNVASDWNLTLKVTSGGQTRLVKIDRFD